MKIDQPLKIAIGGKLSLPSKFRNDANGSDEHKARHYDSPRKSPIG